MPALLLFGLATAASCASALDEAVAEEVSELGGPPTRVTVNGRILDVEAEYLPKVVMCENPDAPPEALKAQAIVARTFLAYTTRGQRSPQIGTGQSQQVYSCPRNGYGRTISAEVKLAVASTRGMYLMWGDGLVGGNFVAGAARSGAECVRGADPTRTERFVTNNNGKTGEAVHGSSIGFVGDPANRGCLGQLLSNCLDAQKGYSFVQLLKYFYGADIRIRGYGVDVALDDPSYEFLDTELDPIPS